MRISVYFPAFSGSLLNLPASEGWLKWIRYSQKPRTWKTYTTATARLYKCNTKGASGNTQPNLHPPDPLFQNGFHCLLDLLELLLSWENRNRRRIHWRSWRRAMRATSGAMMWAIRTIRAVGTVRTMWTTSTCRSPQCLLLFVGAMSLVQNGHSATHNKT